MRGLVNMKTISVAMAVYNGEQFIHKQIDSILSQFKEGDELVISYDHSEDRTYEIISAYAKANPQVKIFVNPTPGLFSNFENAISRCNNDYIFISDQDDIWAEGKRDQVLEDFKKHQCRMVIHNGVHINADDEVISGDFFSTYGIGNHRVRNFLKPRYSGCCTAFDRKLKKLILPIPKNVGAYDHWIGMVGESFSKVYFDDRILLYHRIHGDNVTVTHRRKLLTILKARVNILLALTKRNQQVKRRNSKKGKI